MSKRFFYKMYTSGEVDFFDNEQEYVNERYTCDDVGGLHPMDYWEVVELLNEQQTTIEHLKQRLYDFEKRKIIDESEIDEDVIPKIKLLRTELFGEKYE